MPCSRLPGPRASKTHETEGSNKQSSLRMPRGNLLDIHRCHPGIAVTGTDDQRLHAASDRHYWKGAVDRILLRRGQWPPDRRWRVVKGPEMASIAAEVMVVCQPLVPSIRIQLSSPEQDEQKYLENCPYAGP